MIDFFKLKRTKPETALNVEMMREAFQAWFKAGRLSRLRPIAFSESAQQEAIRVQLENDPAPDRPIHAEGVDMVMGIDLAGSFVESYHDELRHSTRFFTLPDPLPGPVTVLPDVVSPDIAYAFAQTDISNP